MKRQEPQLWEYNTKSPTDLHRGLSRSRSLPETITAVSATPTFDYPKSQIPEHLKMLLQSLGALFFVPGRPGSVWKYFEALGRAIRLSGREACGFWTDLHFADVECITHWLGACIWQHPGETLNRGINIDSGCIKEAIGIEKCR